jgi:hypothetical protein
MAGGREIVNVALSLMSVTLSYYVLVVKMKEAPHLATFEIPPHPAVQPVDTRIVSAITNLNRSPDAERIVDVDRSCGGKPGRHLASPL